MRKRTTSKNIKQFLVICLVCFVTITTIFTGNSSISYGMTSEKNVVSIKNNIKAGDVDGDKEVKLNDAQLALKAALRIITLEPDALQAADLLGDGLVTLDDAQNILLVALKIKDMDEVLGIATSAPIPTEQPVETQSPTETSSVEPTPLPIDFDYETYINEYLNIQVTTEKETYLPGEDVNFTITVTNEGVYPIYMYDTRWFDQLSNVHIELKDVSGSSIIDPEYVYRASYVAFHKILKSGESISVQRTLPLADDLESRYNGKLYEQEFVIETTFGYNNSNWDYLEAKSYITTFPLKVNQATTDINFDYESYIKEYLDIQVTTEKETYLPGEDVNFTITVTNEGVYPIYMYTTHMTDALSNVDVSLKDASGSSIIDPDYWYTAGDAIFKYELSPGESISVKRTLPLADDLESRYHGQLSEQDFMIITGFGYSDSNWDYYKAKRYVTTFPIAIVPTDFDYEAYVNEYLDVQVTTDKEAYIQGEDVNFTITVTNTGEALINMWHYHMSDALSNMNLYIKDVSGSSIIDPEYIFSELTMEFYKELNPGESITVQRTLPLADDLESRYDGKLLDQEFVIATSFTYTNSNWDSSSRKVYSKTFPIAIVPTDFDYEAYVNEHLAIRVTTDKESYGPGEPINLTITANNTGNAPIYMYQTHWRDAAANITGELVTVTGAVVVPDNYPGPPAIFTEVLAAKKSVTVQRTIAIPGDLDTSKQYYIEISFKYANSAWENAKVYTKLIPVTIKAE